MLYLARSGAHRGLSRSGLACTRWQGSVPESLGQGPQASGRSVLAARNGVFAPQRRKANGQLVSAAAVFIKLAEAGRDHGRSVWLASLF